MTLFVLTKNCMSALLKLQVIDKYVCVFKDAAALVNQSHRKENSISLLSQLYLLDSIEDQIEI